MKYFGAILCSVDKNSTKYDINNYNMSRHLKENIEKYEAKLDAATTFEEKKMYADLITERGKTLNVLLQQQQLQGKLIIPSRLSLQHRCFEINPISWLTPHLSISFASFCNIAQTGGGIQEQGE